MVHLSHIRQTVRRVTVLAVGIISSLLLVGAGSASALVQQATAGRRQAAFTAAAEEFNVPANLLLAISYNETRWQPSATATIDGGYGVMGLRTHIAATVSGRDGSPVPA